MGPGKEIEDHEKEFEIYINGEKALDKDGSFDWEDYFKSNPMRYWEWLWFPPAQPPQYQPVAPSTFRQKLFWLLDLSGELLQGLVGLLPRIRDWLDIEISTIRPTKAYSGEEIERYGVRRGMPKLQTLRDAGGLKGSGRGYWGQNLIDSIEQTRNDGGLGNTEAAKGAANNARRKEGLTKDRDGRVDCRGKKGRSLQGREGRHQPAIHAEQGRETQVEKFRRHRREAKEISARGPDS